MKSSILILLLCSSVTAFSPNRIAPFTTELGVSNSLHPNQDPYSKAIPRKGEHQTQPVATHTPSWIERLTMPDVMIDPDYFLTVGVALLCPLIIWYHPCKSHTLHTFTDCAYIVQTISNARSMAIRLHSIHRRTIHYWCIGWSFPFVVCCLTRHSNPSCPLCL